MATFSEKSERKFIIVLQDFQDNPDLAMAVELAQESAYTPVELE